MEPTTPTKIFISFSGDRGKRMAEVLRVSLPGILGNGIRVWTSAQDVRPGNRWLSALNTELETTQVGILCLTPEAKEAPWIMFEAGALGKSVDVSRVFPYCLGFSPSALDFPLSQFQGVRADEAGTFDIVQEINALSVRLDIDQLRRNFNAWWRGMKDDLSTIERAHSRIDPLPSREAELTALAMRMVADRISDAGSPSPNTSLIEHMLRLGFDAFWLLVDQMVDGGDIAGAVALARVFTNGSEPKRALDVLDRMESRMGRQHPEYHVIPANRAYAWNKLEDYQAVLTYIDEVKRLLGKEPLAAYHVLVRANALYKLGEEGEAMKAVAYAKARPEYAAEREKSKVIYPDLAAFLTED